MIILIGISFCRNNDQGPRSKSLSLTRWEWRRKLISYFIFQPRPLFNYSCIIIILTHQKPKRQKFISVRWEKGASFASEELFLRKGLELWFIKMNWHDRKKILTLDRMLVERGHTVATQASYASRASYASHAAPAMPRMPCHACHD